MMDGSEDATFFGAIGKCASQRMSTRTEHALDGVGCFSRRRVGERLLVAHEHGRHKQKQDNRPADCRKHNQTIPLLHASTKKGMCVGGEGAVAKFYSADASLLPATPETFWSFSLAESTP